MISCTIMELPISRAELDDIVRCLRELVGDGYILWFCPDGSQGVPVSDIAEEE